MSPETSTGLLYTIRVECDGGVMTVPFPQAARDVTAFISDGAASEARVLPYPGASPPPSASTRLAAGACGRLGAYTNPDGSVVNAAWCGWNGVPYNGALVSGAAGLVIYLDLLLVAPFVTGPFQFEIKT